MLPYRKVLKLVKARQQEVKARNSRLEITDKIITKAREWIRPEEDYRDNMHLKVSWLIVYA